MTKEEYESLLEQVKKDFDNLMKEEQKKQELNPQNQLSFDYYKSYSEIDDSFKQYIIKDEDLKKIEEAVCNEEDDFSGFSSPFDVMADCTDDYFKDDGVVYEQDDCKCISGRICNDCLDKAGLQAQSLSEPFIRPLPNPTEEDLNDPIFNAIWNCIKSWDINVLDYCNGYQCANGSHAKLILNALNNIGVAGVVENYHDAKRKNENLTAANKVLSEEIAKLRAELGGTYLKRDLKLVSGEMPKCDCGASKANTTHSNWCSTKG